MKNAQTTPLISSKSSGTPSSTATPRSSKNTSGYDLTTLSSASKSSSSRKSSSTTASESAKKSASNTMFVVSLIDNRAREIGIAAMDMRSSEVFLTQFVENSTSYSNACNMIHVYEPTEIILPNTLAGSKLAISLAQAFPTCKPTYIARKFYNETKGDATQSYDSHYRQRTNQRVGGSKPCTS
jgi:DNA mismatch repair ATPase MutS